MPERIDDRIFAKIVDGVDRFLADVGDDPDHHVRSSIEERIVGLAHRLRTDEAIIERGERLKDELLEHPALRGWVGSLWREGKQSLIDASHDGDSELRVRIADSMRGMGERLQSDVELRAKLDRWLLDAVGYVVDHHGSEVGAADRVDDRPVGRDETARKMELQVGRDLQFIRINGTLVGGLAGLVIHALSELLLR